MRRSIRPLLGLLLLGALIAGPVEARTWKDVTGNYTIEADLVGFNDQTVILQRENKELGSFSIAQLCEEDREFLRSKAALETHDEHLNAMQTWTTRKGLKVVGRIVDFAQRDVTIQRRRGRLYVNDKQYENLPGIYQQMLLGIVEHEENFLVTNRADLDRWVMGLRGQPRTYRLDGVVIELENGDEYGVPFFLLSDNDAALLQGGFHSWLQDHKLPEQGDSVPEYTDPNEHQLRLQSLAASVQQDQAVNQQIAMMNLNMQAMSLNMQAIQAGLTSAWEVTLYPVAGNPFPPRWVIALGRNSEIATQQALQQNPGFVSGPVRRVSN